MQLHLLLFACLLALFTSLTVTSCYFLQVLEIRLFFIGQLITALNLYLRGENLWRLSINIFAVLAIFLMSFYQTPSIPDASPNIFILIPLGYLIIAILLVDEDKFVRGLFSNSSAPVENHFEFRNLPKFRPDLFTLYDPYTGESFNTWTLARLHGQMLYRTDDSDSDDSDSGDSDSGDSDSDDSDPDSLSTISEVEEDLHEQLEQFLAPHIEGLIWEIFPPNLPPLALPG